MDGSEYERLDNKPYLNSMLFYDELLLLLTEATLPPQFKLCVPHTTSQTTIWVYAVLRAIRMHKEPYYTPIFAAYDCPLVGLYAMELGRNQGSLRRFKDP